MAFDIRPPPLALRDGLGAAARALNVELTLEKSERLLGYLALLQRWNAVHNLSASNDGHMLLHQHLADCLAVVEPLAKRLGRDGVHALDAGSGAGLPAVILAITFPDWTVTAVDSVAKKVAFLRQVVGELALPNLRPIHRRLEALALEPKPDVITARAFGSLGQLARQTAHLLQPSGYWAAMKGSFPAGEIADLPANCQLFHVEPLAIPGSAAARCLVWMKPSTAAIG